LRRAAAKVSGVAIGIALIALSLVSLGLGGIILYAIGQRVPEIGIRMALGARAREIGGMFVGQGLRTAVIGAVLGIPFSVVVFVAASRLVFGASLAVNTTATIAAAVVLVLVVLLASWIPARHAATVDPLIALRAE
jgi:ABC-type antimicrobial peptide transport system permease subunit